MRGNSNCYVRKFNVLDCASYDSTTVNPFIVLLPGPYHPPQAEKNSTMNSGDLPPLMTNPRGKDAGV
jgi:hypothetical protein